jgi:hypothetical protein
MKRYLKVIYILAIVAVACRPRAADESLTVRLIDSRLSPQIEGYSDYRFEVCNGNKESMRIPLTFLNKLSFSAAIIAACDSTRSGRELTEADLYIWSELEHGECGVYVLSMTTFREVTLYLENGDRGFTEILLQAPCEEDDAN